MHQNRKILILVFLIFLLAIATRLILLDSIPVVFSHDEMGYVTNALSVSLSGVGRTGEWQPLSFKPVEPHLSELPTLFITPFFYLPFSSIINARLASVLMSLTLPFFISGICFILTKSKKTAYLSLIIALFNPWIWQNGRFAFDVFFSLWFYVLGIFIFLRNKNSWKLLSLILFFLGFYCYQGFKLLLPFIGFLLFVFSLIKKNKLVIQQKEFKYSIVFFIGVLSIFLFYLLYQFPAQQGSVARIENQILLPSSEQISNVVNNDRRLSISNNFSNLFINKYVQLGKEILGRLMFVFGLRELFFEINASSTSFSVWNHGIFYLIDALLLLIGIFILFQKKKYKIIIFLGSLLLIASIPVLITNSLWLFFRSSFIIPFLIIVMSIGWHEILKRNQKIFVFSAVLYFIFVANFAFNYFFRYPLFAAEGIFFSPRILASYLQRISTDKPIVVFENEPEFLFTSYIFYNNLLNKKFISNIQQSYKEEKYTINNVTIQKCIPENLVMDEQTTYIFDVDVDYCQTNNINGSTSLDFQSFPQLSSLQIKQIKDSGDNYIIYHDQICSSVNGLQSFLHPQSFVDLNINLLDDQTFCRTWITKNSE